MHVDTNLGSGKPQKLRSESVFSVLFPLLLRNTAAAAAAAAAAIWVCLKIMYPKKTNG